MRERGHLIFTTIVWILLGVFTSAGILNGWVALEESLIDEKQYHQGDRALVYIPMFVFNLGTVATVIIGWLMDRVNLRWLATLSNTCFTTGVALLAFSDRDTFNVLCVALTLMMVGGIGSSLTLYQFANLYSRASTMRSLVNALWASSGLLFLVVGSLGISRYEFYRPYASLCLLLTALAYMVFPNNPYQQGDHARIEFIDLEVDEEADTDLSVVSIVDQPEKSQEDIHGGWHDARSATELNHNSSSTWQEVCSWEFMSLSLFYGVECAVLSWYMTTIQDQLFQLGDVDGKWSRVFVLLSCVLPIPIALSMDRHLATLNYWGTALSSTGAMAASIAWLLPPFNQSISTCWIGFILNAYGRSVAINLVYSRAAMAFDVKHYGSVIALFTLCTVPFGMLQIFIDAISPEWNRLRYEEWNVLFIAITLTMLLYAAFLYKNR